MKIKYTVHGASVEAFQALITHGGQQMVATIPGLVVELVAEDGSSSPTLRISGDVEKAKALFTVGAVISATFKKEAE